MNVIFYPELVGHSGNCHKRYDAGERNRPICFYTAGRAVRPTGVQILGQPRETLYRKVTVQSSIPDSNIPQRALRKFTTERL